MSAENICGICKLILIKDNIDYQTEFAVDNCITYTLNAALYM